MARCDQDAARSWRIDSSAEDSSWEQREEINGGAKGASPMFGISDEVRRDLEEDAFVVKMDVILVLRCERWNREGWRN